jgi:hypothetical protein
VGKRSHTWRWRRQRQRREECEEEVRQRFDILDTDDQGVQQHYILDAGDGLLATMMMVMRRQMKIMVVVMVRYLAAAKGGVRMGS